MKKICSVLLIFVLFFSFCTLMPQAEGENILVNPGFEDGETGWNIQDEHVLSSDAHSGLYAMQVTKSELSWVRFHQYPTTAVKQCGDGCFIASCYVKGVGGASTPIQLAIKTIYPDSEPTYDLSDSVTLTNTYQKLQVRFVAYADTFERIEFYFFSGDKTESTMLVDDCSMIKTADFYDDTLPKPDPSIQRPEKPLVGAIRWDAYYATSDHADVFSVSDQVARTLSYYPEQAPFYAEEKNEYDVLLSFPSSYKKYGTYYMLDNVSSYNLKPQIQLNYHYGTPWEEEARYALNNGLDYFAYLWYGTSDKMSLPRKAHVATDGYLPDGRQLKMCGIAGTGVFEAAENLENKTDYEKFLTIPTDHKELFQAMAQSSYVRISSAGGSMPVLFFYNAAAYIKKTSNALDLLNKEAQFYTGLLHRLNPEKYTEVQSIYYVAMDGSALTRTMVDNYRYAGFQALSRYSFTTQQMDIASADMPGSTVKSETMMRYLYNDLNKQNGRQVTVYSDSFADVAAFNASYNAAYVHFEDGISCIPAVSAGRTNVPRIKTGVYWCDDYGLRYSRPGTADEIAASVKACLQWMEEHPQSTPANMMLIYAWNEHDEGGYLCPTVQTNDRGELLYGLNGKPLVNAAVLNAVGHVIYDHKGISDLYGDVTLNGALDADDITALARHIGCIKKLSGDQAIRNADMDHDASFSASDLTALAKKVSGILS